MTTTLHPLTFRQILQSVDRAELLAALKTYQEDCFDSYPGLIDRLLALPAGPAPMPFVVSYYPPYIYEGTDLEPDPEAVGVSLLNLQYTPAPENLKPYHGAHGCPIPEGCYDADADQYHEVFSVGFTPFGELVDAAIHFQDEQNVRRLLPTDAQIAAAILFEISFYGWDDEQKGTKRAEVLGAMNSYLALTDDQKAALIRGESVDTDEDSAR